MCDKEFNIQGKNNEILVQLRKGSNEFDCKLETIRGRKTNFGKTKHDHKKENKEKEGYGREIC